MTQIGLLVPRSALFPTINFDLVEGLRTSLAHLGVTDIELKTASIGVGGDNDEIYAAAEKMLFDGVTVIAAYINPSTAELLQPLFVNSGSLLIALDAGYHIPSATFKPVNVFTLSLQGTLACRILPRMAAADGHKSLALASCFYDAGYRSYFGFYNGLADCGSEVVYNVVTKLKKEEFDISGLVTYLAEHPSTAILNAFCGDMTQDMFRGAAEAGIFASHPTYASPFTAEETWLAKIQYPGGDVTACVPWASKLATPENEAFIAALKKKNRSANLFSLLTWEAGIVIAKAIQTEDINERISSLENYSFVSPRGTVTLDKTTHSSEAPLYEATIAKNAANEFCVLVPGSAVEGVETDRARLWEEINAFDGKATSWFNVYGCID